MAALIETSLPARALLALCLDVERAMGRRRLERWGPRTIDIDILIYGEARIDEPDLTIPHPRLCERAFALAPLAEIAPRLRVAGREVGRLLAAADRAGIEVDAEASARVRGAIAAVRDWRRLAPRRRWRQKATAELTGLNETPDRSRQENRRNFVARGRVSSIAAKSNWFWATPIRAAALGRGRGRVDAERDLGVAQDVGAPPTREGE